MSLGFRAKAYKAFCGMAGIVPGIILLHALPYIYENITNLVYGQPRFLDPIRFQGVLFVGYLLFGVAFVVTVWGLLHDYVQHRRDSVGKGPN